MADALESARDTIFIAGESARTLLVAIHIYVVHLQSAAHELKLLARITTKYVNEHIPSCKLKPCDTWDFSFVSTLHKHA